MPTIKKGTYRFNDVLTVPSANLAQEVSFKATDIVIVTEEMATQVNTDYADAIAEGLYEALTQGSYTLNCECYEINWAEWTSAETFNKSYRMSYQCNLSSSTVEPRSDLLIVVFDPFNSQEFGVVAYNEEDGWESEILKTITITQDQDVTDDFYTWFTANAKPIIKAGIYKFIDKPAMLGEYNFLGLDFSSRSVELNVTQEMADELTASLKELSGNEFPIVNAGLYNVTFHYGGFDGIIDYIAYEKTDVLPTVQPFDEGLQLFLGFAQSSYDDVYSVEQGWESDEKRYIVVEQDQEVTELTHQWFTANAVEQKVIKAGTYKFNDVIESNWYAEANVNFTVSGYISEYGIAVIANCDKILNGYIAVEGGHNVEMAYRVVSTEPDVGVESGYHLVYTDTGGWRSKDWQVDFQTITITEDTAVSAEFAEWFTANTVEQKKISGVWKFSDNIFCYPYERYQITATPEEKIGFLKTYGVLCKPIDLSSIQEGLYANCFSMANSFGDMYVDGQPTVFYSGVYIGMCADGEYTGIDVISVEYLYDQTVDFGAKPQYVSLDFYNWLTENAVEQKQIVGKWRFNETVDASIMVSEEVQFTATTRYLVDGIIYTGYGTKISIDNGSMAYYIDHSVPPDPNETLSDWVYVYGTYNGIDNVWTPLFDSNVRVVDFGTEPQYVSAYFYNWFTNNANKILEIKMKDLFFNYNESQAQVGYKSAVLYKKQGDTKYRFLCASESVPFPYGTKDTFEYDLLNSSSKGLAEGKNTLEQKEVELLYTPNNAYLFEQLKGQVLDFMSLTPDKIGYKYHGTISFRPNDATADIHRGTYTITPMGASEVPYFMARKECYVPLFFADVIPYEISLAELGDAESVALNLGLVGNYKEAVFKYDTFSETTNRFSGTSNDITVTNGIGTIPKNAGLYLITAEPKETDKTTHSGCFTLVYITD